DPVSPPPKSSRIVCRGWTEIVGPRLNRFKTWTCLDLGGGAGYCPRVRMVYYDARLSPYPSCAGTLNISGFVLQKKAGRGQLCHVICRQLFPRLRKLVQIRDDNRNSPCGCAAALAAADFLLF